MILKSWPLDRGGRVELDQDGPLTVWYFASADDGDGMGYEPGMLPIGLVRHMGALFADLCDWLYRCGAAAAVYQPADVRMNAVRAQRAEAAGWR